MAVCCHDVKQYIATVEEKKGETGKLGYQRPEEREPCKRQSGADDPGSDMPESFCALVGHESLPFPLRS